MTIDCNGPFSVVSYGNNFFLSECEFLNINSPLIVSIKQMGSVPKNSVPSQHLHQLNKNKTEPPFSSGVQAA